MLSPPKLKFPEPENVSAEGVRDAIATVREQRDQVEWSRSLLSGVQDQEELDDIEIVGPIFENWVCLAELQGKTRTPPILSLAFGALLAVGINALWNSKSSRSMGQNALLVGVLGGAFAGGGELLYHQAYAKLPLVSEDMPHAALEAALKDIASDDRKVSRVRGIRAAWKRRAVGHNARTIQAAASTPPIGEVVRSTARLGLLLR